METLDGTAWDVIIAGTGFTESLLALSLSRSGLRVLHVDQNQYYGGREAAYSLTEAEAWAEHFASDVDSAIFSHAAIGKKEEEDENGKLAPPRAYSLALAPHIIYARSRLLSTLVSSRLHNQLDFQAVGSWFVVSPSSAGTEGHARLVRVPSGREDVFQDTSFNLQTKRSLMKFLKFVSNYEEQPEKWEPYRSKNFPEFLSAAFALPAQSLEPIMALTLSQSSLHQTTTGFALPRIARHLRSIGVFGSGFGAVLPKWGGLAEVSQVACRACAVGGGIYVLGKGITNAERQHEEQSFLVELSDGEKVTATWLTGSTQDLPASIADTPATEPRGPCSKKIYIVSAPLKPLFPPTSEGGVMPAGAVIFAPAENATEPPVHIFVHSSEAGECPMNQYIVYASIEMAHERGFERIEQAVLALVSSITETSIEQSQKHVLWSMQYQQQVHRAPTQPEFRDGLIVLSPLSSDLSLEDDVLDEVRNAWLKITGGNEDDFMNFDAREGVEDDETV